MAGASIKFPGGKYLKNGAARECIHRLHGGRCWYCSRPTKLRARSQNDPELATIDHIIPLSAGGKKSSLDNLVLACRRCNGRRGTTPAAEFKAFWDAAAGPFCWPERTRSERRSNRAPIVLPPRAPHAGKGASAAVLERR